MRINRLFLMVASFVLSSIAFYIFSVFYFLFPFTDSMVTQGTADDGTEVYVIQSFNGLAESYKVSLYSRYPGGNWRRMYLEHEDSRWRDSKLEFHQNQVSVFRGEELHSTFVLPGAESLAINPGERDEANGYYYPGSWTIEDILQDHSRRYVERSRTAE